MYSIQSTHFVYYNILEVIMLATFGERLRSLRLEHNLTQEELGNKFGLKKSRISQYELNKRQPDDELKKQFAQYFSVTLDYLMGLSDVKNDSKSYIPIEVGDTNNVDDELRELLTSPEFRDILVAFHDYKNWTDEDKREVINFIKFKRMNKN